jgi:hypothetical protein
MSSISRTLSNASTVTVLSEGFDQEVLDCINGGVHIDVRTRQAWARLWFLTRFPNRLIPNTEIDSLKVLEAMLIHAPAERGKLFVACAIFCCQDNVSALVGLAHDWVKLLLWPCMTRDNFFTVIAHNFP